MQTLLPGEDIGSSEPAGCPAGSGEAHQYRQQLAPSSGVQGMPYSGLSRPDLRRANYSPVARSHWVSSGASLGAEFQHNIISFSDAPTRS